MADNYLRLYAHFVWATWDRLPLIEPAWEGDLYHEIHNEVHHLGAKVLELGGIENHLHLLLRFTATHSIAELMQQTTRFDSQSFQMARRLRRAHRQSMELDHNRQLHWQPKTTSRQQHNPTKNGTPQKPPLQRRRNLKIPPCPRRRTVARTARPQTHNFGWVLSGVSASRSPHAQSPTSPRPNVPKQFTARDTSHVLRRKMFQRFQNGNSFLRR